MRRDRLPYLLLPVAALLCILPLVLQGPSCGHDFDFHLLNWFEAAAQFRHGNLHPQWAVSPAWNAGEPRFVFYPPISWTLGAILGLLLPWPATPIAYTWLALLASGLAMHRLARAHAGPTAALLAATLYLANPYMLFTAYERTAYAELLAAAWLPLLLHAILKPRPTIPGIAIPVALLWLTNAPAAVMATYTLALLALIRLWLPYQTTEYRAEQDRHPSQSAEDPKPLRSLSRTPPTSPTPASLALTTAAATLLGLTLAAFYILPAAIERRYVQIAMVILPGMRIDDNTLFHHTGLSDDALFHDAVLHTASIVALLLLTASALALIAARRRSPTIVPLTILTVTIALLLTPITLPLWRHLPELAFLQFPWRLLAVLAAALGLSSALALNRLRLNPIPRAIAALALTAALTAPAIHTFRQPCDAPDTVPARLAVFATQSGSEPTDEYTPANADNEALGQHNPPFWLSPDPDAPPPATSHPAPTPYDFQITTPAPQYLILNLRQYPGWHILLDNHDSSPNQQNARADGLANLPIPAGTTHIHLAFRATPFEHAADAASSLALLLLLILLALKRRNPPRPTSGIIEAQ